MSENRDKDFKRMSEKPDKKLRLTLHELTYIEDNISLMIDGSEFTNMLPLKPLLPSALMAVDINFIDKIGQAFLIASEEGSVVISVSEMDLYLLRELCLSRVEYFGQKVGLSLKKKVLYTLYSKKNKQDDLLEKLLKDVDLGDK
tara:strand:- start:632 stop:1063 length:432 start_codon:yes stop_codon:yes gene_type:complete